MSARGSVCPEGSDRITDQGPRADRVWSSDAGCAAGLVTSVSESDEAINAEMKSQVVAEIRINQRQPAFKYG